MKLLSGKIIFILFVLAPEWISGCADEESPPASLVPLASVLVNPEQLFETKIEVFGYLSEPPATAIYLTKDHETHGDHVSSLLVGLGKYRGRLQPACRPGYVFVVGTLRSSDGGDVYLGDVETVSRSSPGRLFPQDCIVLD